MKTEILIPKEPAPSDPSWMIKKFSGKTLSPFEQEKYFTWKHELNLRRLKNRLIAPGMGSLTKVLEATNSWKIKCTTT